MVFQRLQDKVDKGLDRLHKRQNRSDGSKNNKLSGRVDPRRVLVAVGSASEYRKPPSSQNESQQLLERNELERKDDRRLAELHRPEDGFLEEERRMPDQGSPQGEYLRGSGMFDKVKDAQTHAPLPYPKKLPNILPNEDPLESVSQSSMPSHSKVDGSQMQFQDGGTPAAQVPSNDLSGQDSYSTLSNNSNTDKRRLSLQTARKLPPSAHKEYFPKVTSPAPLLSHTADARAPSLLQQYPQSKAHGVDSSLQVLETQRMEDDRFNTTDDDSDNTLRSIYGLLGKVKLETSSLHFDWEGNRPGRLSDIEKALKIVTGGYASAHQQVKVLNQEVWKLKGSNTTLSTQLDEWQQKHDNVLRKLQQEHQDVIDAHKSTVAQLKEVHQIQLERERETARKELAKIDREMIEVIQKYEDEKLSQRKESTAQKTLLSQEFQRQRDSMLANHQKEKLATEMSMRKLEIKLEEEKNRHKEEKLRLLDRFADEKRLMSQGFQQQKEMTSSKYQKERLATQNATRKLELQLDEEKIRHKEEKLRLVNDITNEKAARNQIIREQISLMASQHKTEVSTLEVINRKLREDLKQEQMVHEAEIDELTQQHATEKAEMRGQLELKLTTHTRNLQITVEDLKRALVRRDHFKAMTDHEVTYRFRDITSEVDGISRVEWDLRKERSWIFDDHSFSQSENKRRAKHHIMQNSLWVILYEMIFCTPFRVLGDEGKALELEWLQKHGQDRTVTGAPAPGRGPTQLSETWRYETIKSRLEVISKPLKEGEPGYKIKVDFEKQVAEISEQICRELARVALVRESEKQRVKELVMKAAKLWFEVGQQRCRMFVLMSDSANVPTMSGPDALDHDRGMNLVIVPEIRRIGNAQGERLELNELVCKGKFERFIAS